MTSVPPHGLASPMLLGGTHTAAFKALGIDFVSYSEQMDTSTPAGKMVFNYGDPGDSMYVVRSGVVEISFAG